MREWIKEMDLYFEVAGNEDRRKPTYWINIDSDIRGMLEGINISEDDKVGVSQIKKKLIELFGEMPKESMSLITEFCNRKQGPDKNVRVFATTLESLSRPAFPDSLNLEKYIMDQFIAGVRNKQIQLVFLQDRPNTVRELLEIATRWEEAYERQDRDKKESEKGRSHSGPASNNNIIIAETRHRLLIAV